MDVGRAVQTRPDGDVEAGVEDRAEVLGRRATSGRSARVHRRGVSGSHRPAICQPSASSAQSTTRWSSRPRGRRSSSGPRSATQATPAASPATPRTLGVPPSRRVRKHRSAGSGSTNRRRCRPRARGGSGRRSAGRRTGRPVPVGPYRALWPGKASRSIGVSRRSIGTTPADWAASTRNSAPASRTIARDRLDRLDGAQHVRGVGHRHERRPGVIAPADRLGIDVAVVGGDPRQRDHAGFLECAAAAG